MKRTERNLLITVSLVLVSLFLLSSTDLFLSEKKNDVYVISVLIDDDTSKNWDNFRMGMDRAAEKWNADVSFVTLYDKGNTLQQEQLLKREVENGTQAIILSPADCGALTEAVDDIPAAIPVIALGARVESPRVRSVITAEPAVMGAELGARIGIDDKMLAFSQVIEVTFRQNRTDTTLLSDSLRRALPDHLPVNRITVRSDAELDALMVRLDALTTPTAVVALDSTTLLSVAEKLEPSTQDTVALYGVGWSSGLLPYIESGVISDVGVYSDYDIGYLSMEAAIRYLQSEPVQKEYKVQQALIPADQIHSKAYEMMLFPIV
ncbi:MAG: substrate-binding domain-containing protein [Angelakisella sp.]